MLCVILQPSYIPWRGYFDQIRRADTFVFLDTAPYDARGWRNRNRIKSADGSRWLTIPVQRKGSQQARTPLSEIRIHWEHDWRVTHRRSLEHAYARAPHWKEMTPLLDQIYGDRHERLVDLTIHATHCVASQLGLGGTRFLRASELDDVPGEGSERIQTLLNRVGADRYLTGPSAQNYLDIDAL
ncbi:MAG: WbqC family protein, partial [Acidobacteriota bacterium]|nr:WbqC family protein [Acidobacteriota bacterium]